MPVAGDERPSAVVIELKSLEVPDALTVLKE